MGLIVNLIEIYPSIQGESSCSGIPTTFVRLAACNLRCVWCDTTYSFGRGQPFTTDEIVKTVEEYGYSNVCITGGEPLLQDPVHPLMKTLCDRGYTLSLETGGSLSTAKVDPRVRIILDIKCPGSQMHNRNNWENLQILRSHDEVKFVIGSEEDYSYAVEVCHKYDLFTHLSTVLFSPVYDLLEPRELVEWILRDKIQVRLNLQIHKYIWSSEEQGV